MKRWYALFAALLLPFMSLASEADLKIPELTLPQNHLLLFGFAICVLGMLFGYYQYLKVRKLRAYPAMLDVARIIFETCKTYLIQQGKFLLILFAIIGVCIAFYFGYLQENTFGGVVLIGG
jgi:K(+)-stimulated pyrophosphate-energized sodium pump